MQLAAWIDTACWLSFLQVSHVLGCSFYESYDITNSNFVCKFHHKFRLCISIDLEQAIPYTVRYS